MNKKKKRVGPSRLDAKTTTLAAGDVLIETTTTAFARKIAWDDLMEATTLEPDSDVYPPWKDSDGWEHELVSFESDHEPDNDYIVRERHRDPKMVWVSPKQVEEWGVRAYAHAHGASKQVAFERAARNLARTRAQIAKWHNQGWEAWFVLCKFGNYGASLGCGVGEPEDFEDMREEVAAEVADELRKDGFEIVGEPDWVALSSQRIRDGLAGRIAHNLDFDDVKAYRRWLGKKVSWDGVPASSPAQEKASC